jgi:hypothetical protein
LPEGEADFPGRWRAIKEGFSKSVGIGESRSPVMIRRGERGIWQRRYWEHTIRDEQAFGGGRCSAFAAAEGFSPYACCNLRNGYMCAGARSAPHRVRIRQQRPATSMSSSASF